MLFQLKKLPEIINLTRFLKSFWILYIDQIIVYNAFYSMLTFYIIKDRCQMHTLKVFRSPVWLLLHKLSSPHYRYIRKMRRGDRLPLTQLHKPRCRIKSIPFGKYQRYSICYFRLLQRPKKMEKDQEHR
jgi:hypothetical protein